MMRTITRTFVTFNADFHDDSIWDQTASVVVPQGAAVAKTIVCGLESRGVKCTPITQHSFYGWRFVAQAFGERAECILQGAQPYLLICNPKTTFVRRLIGAWRALQELPVMIHGVLMTDQRFNTIKWFTRDEYEGGQTQNGAQTPM
jgi:hypothetical protein